MEETFYSKMMNGMLKQLELLANESKKYLLQPAKFRELFGQFTYGAAQVLQLVSSPAIRITDKDGEIHFIVGGEKWKLFAAMMSIDHEYSTDGEKQATIVCTNPVQMCVESFEVTAINILTSMNDYEKIYNEGIISVMKINDKMNELAALTSCGDQQSGMLGIIEDLKKTGELLDNYYK